MWESPNLVKIISKVGFVDVWTFLGRKTKLPYIITFFFLTLKFKKKVSKWPLLGQLLKRVGTTSLQTKGCRAFKPKTSCGRFSKISGHFVAIWPKLFKKCGRYLAKTPRFAQKFWPLLEKRPQSVHKNVHQKRLCGHFTALIRMRIPPRNLEIFVQKLLTSDETLVEIFLFNVRDFQTLSKVCNQI